MLDEDCHAGCLKVHSRNAAFQAREEALAQPNGHAPTVKEYHMIDKMSETIAVHAGESYRQQWLMCKQLRQLLNHICEPTFTPISTIFDHHRMEMIRKLAKNMDGFP